MKTIEPFINPDPDRRQYEVSSRIRKLMIDATLSGKQNSKNRLQRIQDKISKS